MEDGIKSTYGGYMVVLCPIKWFLNKFTWPMVMKYRR